MQQLAFPTVLRSVINQVPRVLPTSMLPCMASSVKNKIGVAQCLDTCNRMISNAAPQRLALPDAMLQIPRTSFLGLPGSGPAGFCCAGAVSLGKLIYGREKLRVRISKGLRNSAVPMLRHPSEFSDDRGNVSGHMSMTPSMDCGELVVP